MKYSRAVLLSAIVVLWCNISSGAPASSHAAKYSQPDGTQTPDLFLRGDEHYAWLTDANGFTVLQDSNKWYVYAWKTGDGSLEPLDAKVGDVDPRTLGLEPNLLHDSAFLDHDDDEEGILRLRRLRKLAGMPEAILCDHQATSVDPCYLKQLALMVRFSDHGDRKLPSPEEIDVLFNHNGPTGTSTAPTGSISDVYRSNSFDRFVLDTHVSGWVQISKTEAYCSGGQNGFNLDVTRECWAEALEKYAQTLGDNGLQMFDGDGDGFIDGMAIVHSGVGAEENGEDCETNALFNNRIWSHSVPQAPNFEFTSEFGKDVGVKAGRFYVFSSVFGVCPEQGAGTKWETGRIAVGVHEGGHFLGLKDLYGKPGVDYGIGNWGFMGNMYGWDVSGNYPGLMSGYSRHLLGWLDVVDITFSQQVTIISACDSNKIYRITHRMASDEFGEEYLLMENRQACGHDVKLSHDGLDRQGIVIWHVDHTGLLGEVDGQDVIRFNTAKAPNSPEWPKIHSRVAILQGDGNFDLENNVNRGDDFDSFRIQAGAPSIAKMISSEGVTMNDGTVKKYPNTNSIAYGEERETGIIIEILDSPQNDMRVKVTLLDTNGLSVAVAAAEESTETPVAKPAETKVDTPPAQLEAEDETPPTESETPEQDQNAGTSSITQIGGSTASVFNQFSFSGGSNANNSTEAPADAPSDAPAATLTEAPQATVETQSEMYTCDNSEYEEFEVSGVGETPSMNTIKQCQFIKPEKRNPAEWCNALDLWNNNQPVYMKCQRECNTITGCPASVKNETSVVQSQTTVVLPTEAPATSSTDVSIAPVATPTDATVSDPTDTPVVSPTESPVALQKNDVPAPAPTDMPDPLATEHSVPAVTELPVAPEMEDDVISAPTEAPTILATQPPPPVVNSSVAPPTEAPVVPLTEAPITLTTEAPLTTESTQSEAYSCDNSKYEEFEVTGLGETPTMNIIKQCQFIQPDKRDPTEWCNALDMWNNNQPVYHKCQRECNVITGCPPPEPDETRRHLRH